MKIAVFGIRSIPSTYSGYETFCTAFLPELVERGHDVTLFTRGAIGKQEPYKGVRRIGLPSVRTKQLDTLSHAFVSAWTARRGEYDVALVFNVANAPALSLLKTSIPRVLNVDGQEWKRGKWSEAGRRVFRGCAQLAKYTATELVTDCDEMRRIYADQFNSVSNVIAYPSVQLIDNTLTVGDERVRLKELELLPNEYVITGGRFVPENNIERIVRSYIESEFEEPIAIMGTANYDSPVQRELDRVAKTDKRVKLLGHVEDRELFGILLKNARCYFHGHSVGGINPSLVEAMGVGAFIAANDTPFNREGLGDAGVYFAEPELAAQALTQSLDTPHAQENFRLAAQQRAHDEFSLATITDRYEAVLHKAIGRKDSDGSVRRITERR